MLHSSTMVAAPVDVVWPILVTVAHWPRWGPTVTAVDCDVATISQGTRGRVRTPVGVWLPFEVTHVETQRCWSWRVAGVQATEHRVAPAAGGCEVSFGVPVWAPAYLPVCALALRRIAALAERDHSGRAK